VLLVELPGQEQALLQAMGPHRLARFGCIVLCACTQWPATAALAQLQAAGWARQPDDLGQPLWPVHRLDRHGAAAAAPWPRAAAPGTEVAAASSGPGPLQDELERARLALSETRRELQALQQRPAETSAWAAERARLLAALEAARQEVRDARDLHAAEHRQWQRTLQAERQRHDALARQLADAEAQIGMLKDLLLRDDAA